MYCCFTGIEDI